ncbi:glycolate oxidase, subunit GlcD [[Synechococcus] sp. NIES-970]|uniref:glycolate oxidase subunit GlcD n=1 Tax=Picosynechococcus sp. NKBG15041c TaxID=1407650 RepID=UPI000419A6B6|nr:glycolate oxidase subunit GlcD [Picosynechococcus sp. NKBG15041c]BAW97601.1 glycolate oxidase, subunit GlcD [[Synechococcus] sp. NIES-970]
MVFASTSSPQPHDWPWIQRRLEEIVGKNGVVRRKEEILTYECDGLSAYRKRPALVVLPRTTAEIAAIAQFCHEQEIPWVARGAGTGLSGGALPLEDGILIVTARMREILNVDLENQQITVQPGVINNWVTQAVSGAGFYYAPDPSSQTVCSIGGNVAENSGGVHCFKYGVTTNHVLKLKVVTPTGEVVTLGGLVPEMPGYDLMGVFVGSEGTLGIATEITLKVLKQPEAVCVLLADYASIEAAGKSVAAIVSAGIIPAGMEIMDNFSINAVEDIVKLNCYPRDAAAILLIEIDGMTAEIHATKERIKAICLAQGARQITSASDAETRMKLWKGRKSAFAAAGNISPDYFVQDGVIPRTKLAEVLTEINAIGDRHGYKIANVFHAGDGNLHPLILYNSAIPGDLEAVEKVGGEILKLCVAKGGSISGEHGIGADKKMYMPDMFNDADLETMGYVRNAFNPKGLANPGKLFPTPRTCGESAKMTNVSDCKDAEVF